LPIVLSSPSRRTAPPPPPQVEASPTHHPGRLGIGAFDDQLLQFGHLSLAEKRWSARASPYIRQAADYYRKAITVIRDHPDNYDPAFETVFQKLVDRLEAQANAAAG